MNIATLIHTNQIFSWTIQLAVFFLLLLLLRWYLLTTRKRQEAVQAQPIAKRPLEQTVSRLLPTIGLTTILFLLLSFFPPLMVLSGLVVCGMGIGGYWLVWRKRVP